MRPASIRATTASVRPGRAGCAAPSSPTRDGVAAFDTLYPGWYEGRAPHIHVKAWLADGRELTSQLYFPDALSDAVYGQGPYAGRAGRRQRNGDDGIFRRAGGDVPMTQVARAGGGYDGAIVIALG